MTVAYLDSSALVKTVVVEPESQRLVEWLRAWPDRASSALVRTEVVRAVFAYAPETVDAVRRELRALRLIEVTGALLDAAAELPQTLRSLDAIHVASAQSLAADLGALVTYDRRMADAARELGLEVVSP